MPSEKVFVHQPAVHLVLDERHQNARGNKPADNLQNKHHTSNGLCPPRGKRLEHGIKVLILVRIPKVNPVHFASATRTSSRAPLA